MDDKVVMLVVTGYVALKIDDDNLDEEGNVIRQPKIDAGFEIGEGFTLVDAQIIAYPPDDEDDCEAELLVEAD